MRKPVRSNWLGWRVIPTGAAVASTEPYGRFGSRAERPGPDGIRHGLVARIRAEIAAGTYDTEDKWLLAEDRLCRATANSR